jgi:purine catabolism regulator
MAVTVESIMEIEAFSKHARLIAGHAGIKNRITYVTIAEAPDFYQWVAGGEFVLSTLYAFKDHPELRAHAYTELAKNGVAAIGIKTKRFFSEIPEDIIEIATRYSLPVFEIKHETWFREVIQAISAELNNEQTNLLLEVERHYKELSQVALVGGTFDEFIRGFGRRLRSKALFLRADCKLLGSYPAGLEERTENVEEKIEELRQRTGEIVQYTRSGPLQIFPCAMKGQALGFLILPEAEPLNEKLMLMANQLTTFLTMKLIDQLETEQKSLTALLDDILYKHNLTEEELRERLALHGLKHKNLYRTVFIRQRADHPSAGDDTVFRACANKLRGVLDNALIIMKPDEVVVIAADQEEDKTSPPSWARSLGAEAMKEDFPLVIGIGPAVANAAEIESSYHMARSSAKAGQVFGQGGILYYWDYLARLLLMKSVDTAEQKYLQAMIITPLLTHDEKHNSQLLKTIGELIFVDDLETAAAALYVHINTVRYRLSKVKQLTGHDFLSSKGRYVISTAYLTYRCSTK